MRYESKASKESGMYVTRPLSLYRTSPSAVTELVPEGPSSGVMVIEDEESKWFFGLLKRRSVKEAPFPQNKIMELCYTKYEGEHRRTIYFYALLIPALNLPLSSNQYYIIKSRGNSKGLACTSSREDDMSSCFCFNFIHDKRPQLFDPRNVYQQFRISDHTNCLGSCGFVSKPVAPDGISPCFLRRKGWRAYTTTLKNFEPTQALGLDAALRARLPELNSEPVVVGKWYCPFIFIRDGDRVDAQMKNSPYYEMTLEQNWEEIFGCYNDGDIVNNSVGVDVSVVMQVVLVGGLAMERAVVGDGVMWFGPIGVSMAIVERVKWEQGKAGFIWGKIGEHQERVMMRDEFKGDGVWKRFGCYVLVERLVLKRMDGSLVLAWEFRHTHQIRTKWE